jgi:hypothetical protein
MRINGMAKKYGDRVTYVRNNVELNALVVQSNPQPDGEHLTVLYLDPAFDSPIIGGQNLQRAIATAFVVPLKPGLANGWKDEVSPEQLAEENAQLKLFIEHLSSQKPEPPPDRQPEEVPKEQ